MLNVWLQRYRYTSKKQLRKTNFLLKLIVLYIAVTAQRKDDNSRAVYPYRNNPLILKFPSRLFSGSCRSYLFFK